jgi:hypothetical protein
VIEVALQKLNQLTVTEGLTATAQILKHTSGLVGKFRFIEDS